jgi:hypothetical protein
METAIILVLLPSSFNIIALGIINLDDSASSELLIKSHYRNNTWGIEMIAFYLFVVLIIAMNCYAFDSFKNGSNNTTKISNRKNKKSFLQ